MGITSHIKKICLNAQVLSLGLALTLIAVLFVVFRMKGVEQNYRFNTISKKIAQTTMEQKELRAKKAKLLSVKNLRKIAKKYNLQRAQQSQIIIIP